MGAWGVGPFENDDAADWLAELAGGDPVTAIRGALGAVATTSRNQFLQAPEASVAVAAADVVAALAGETGAELPEEVRAWADARTIDAGPLLPLARAAVVRIMGENSELAELWHESGDEEWRQFMVTLERRLGTP